MLLVELHNQILPAGNYKSVSGGIKTALQNAINLAFMQDAGYVDECIAISRDTKKQIIHQYSASYAIKYFWHNKLRNRALLKVIDIM